MDSFVVSELGLGKEGDFQTIFKNGILACKLASIAYSKPLKTIEGKHPAMWSSNWTSFNNLLKEMGGDSGCLVNSNEFIKDEIPYELVISLAKAMSELAKQGKFKTQLDFSKFTDFLDNTAQIVNQKACEECQGYCEVIDKLRQ